MIRRRAWSWSKNVQLRVFQASEYLLILQPGLLCHQSLAWVTPKAELGWGEQGSRVKLLRRLSFPGFWYSIRSQISHYEETSTKHREISYIYSKSTSQINPNFPWFHNKWTTFLYTDREEWEEEGLVRKPASGAAKQRQEFKKVKKGKQLKLLAIKNLFLQVLSNHSLIKHLIFFN